MEGVGDVTEHCVGEFLLSSAVDVILGYPCCKYQGIRAETPNLCLIFTITITIYDYDILNFIVSLCGIISFS